MSEEIKRKPGNPAWIKGGPSPNPNGRPRAGLALAERIRERVEPDVLIDFMLQVISGQVVNADQTTSFTTIEQRGAAVKFLAEHGWIKPPTQIETGALGNMPDLSAMTPEQLVSMEDVLRAAANGASLPGMPSESVLRELRDDAAIVERAPADAKRIGGNE